MELAVIGVVTAESVVRTWTRGGGLDLLVDEPDRLRNALGIGALDREPMVPNAKTEMVLLDDDRRQLMLVSPFQAGETPRLLTKPFDVVPVGAVHGDAWSDDTVEALGDWLASRLIAAAARGEDLVVFERDMEERGWRVASVACSRDGDGDWCWRIATNDAPEGYALWDAAADGAGGAVVETPYEGVTPISVAVVLLSVVSEWPGGPRDIVFGWDPNEDGCNLHAAAMLPRREDAAPRR